MEAELTSYSEYLLSLIQGKVVTDNVVEERIFFQLEDDFTLYYCLQTPILTLERVIREYFPTSQIKETVEVSILCPENTENTTIFTIYEKYIYLNHLGACKDKGGAYFLNRIIHLGKDLLKEKIELGDGSFYSFDRECIFPLSMYSILLHGRSWYNKFGFKSVNHERDMEYNAEIRKMNVVEYLNLEDINLLRQVQQNLSDIFDENDTIADFVKKISLFYLPRLKGIPCNETMKLICEVILKSAFILQYDNSLHLDL